MFKCPISHREGWRKKKVLVQAQIQPSQAAEFSSKAGKRWTGTAAEGAAASLERAHAVCRDGSTALLLCPTARAAHGDVCHENPPGTAYSSQCCTPVCAHGQLALEELKLVEEKCIKDCLVFLQYAGEPVPVRLPFYFHQKHLIASGPC